MLSHDAPPTPQDSADDAPVDVTGRWVLFATILASSMAFIDATALNVAIPAIQADLNASGAEILWIVNAYQLLLAALILVGGSLGDHFGRKRVFMIGIGIFAGASIACGLAPNTEILIGARFIQGLGGALMIPGSLAIIAVYFDDNSRGTAIGTWSALTTIMNVLGPVLGGELAELGLWRAIFFINVPLAALAIVALVAKVPESYDDDVAAQPLDVIGAGLITLGLAGLTYGFIEAPARGWGHPLIAGTLLGGGLCVLGFVAWQRYTAHPVMPLELFKSPTFSGTNAMTLFLYGALSGALFFLPLNLVQVQGYSQSVTGRAMLPFAILLAVISRWAGRLADRHGPRPLLTIGPALTGVGFVLFAVPGVTSGPDAYWTTFFPALVVMGIGMGLTVAPLTTAVMSAVPQRRSGVASGINNAVARTAGVLAIAILGALALIAFNNSLLDRAEALNVDQAAVQALEAQADKLGETQPPDSLSSSLRDNVQRAIDWAFVDMFRLINLIAAGMSWLSALLAWLMVEKQIKRAPALAPEGAD